MYSQITVLRDHYLISDEPLMSSQPCFMSYDDAIEEEEWIREYLGAQRDVLKLHDEKVAKPKVYLKDLVPTEYKGEVGHWKIVVEFIPEEE
jgi:hypothetical protein